MRGNTRILLGSILLFAVLNQVEAATITWTNTAGGNWSDAANWSPNQVSESGLDDVIITAPGAYIVTVKGPYTVNSLALGGAGSSPTLRIDGAGYMGSSLAVNSSYTNFATIELTSGYANISAGLTVNGGPLVNDAAGVILVSTGVGGGRYIYAELDNRGTLTLGDLDYPLVISENGAAHTNSGTITANAAMALAEQRSPA